MKRRLISLVVTLCLSAASAAADGLRIVSPSAPAELLAELRAELVEDETPQTLFEVRRQARNAQRRATDYLNSQGYYAPEMTVSIGAGDPPQAVLQIVPGPRFRLASVTVDLDEVALTEVAQAALDRVQTLAPGDVAIPRAILDQEARLIAALKLAGYADARAADRGLIGDREAGTLALTYRIHPGPSIRFGAVQFPSDTRTRRAYLQRLVPFEPGDRFTPQTLTTLNRRLNALRMYRRVSVQLAESAAGVDENGEQMRDVLVSLEDRDRYTLSTGTSYSTSEGPGLTGRLVRRNATRRGDILTGSMTLATLERAFEIDWRVPNVTAFDRTLVLSAEARREETDAFDREAATFSGALEIRHSPELSLVIGAASEFTREEDAFEQRDQQILSTSLGVRLDRSDDPLDATTGWRVDSRVEPGLVVGDRATQFVSLNGQLSAYQALDASNRIVAATRVRSGFVFGADLSDLPVSRRFFAGGGGSARGFEYQSVGPVDATGTPTGGRGLLEMSGELRWRRDRGLGFVAFLDGASVSEDQVPQIDQMRYSIGLGVRYKTLIGPIRFDLATPIDPNDGDDPVQVYVSIGQAF